MSDGSGAEGVVPGGEAGKWRVVLPQGHLAGGPAVRSASVGIEERFGDWESVVEIWDCGGKWRAVAGQGTGERSLRRWVNNFSQNEAGSERAGEWGWERSWCGIRTGLWYRKRLGGVMPCWWGEGNE